MRASNRTRILDAVLKLIERDGVTGVTFDAVAAETGLTRGGLLYHFPSREELILATHRHLAEQWEAGMREIAGGAAEATQAAQRHAAYIRTSAEAATRVELLLMLESLNDPELDALWRDILDRWAPPAPERDDAASLSHFIARLAADGLWVHEAMSGQALPARLKQRIVRELIGMVEAQAAQPRRRTRKPG